MQQARYSEQPWPLMRASVAEYYTLTLTLSPICRYLDLRRFIEWCASIGKSQDVVEHFEQSPSRHYQANLSSRERRAIDEREVEAVKKAEYMEDYVVRVRCRGFQCGEIWPLVELPPRLKA